MPTLDEIDAVWILENMARQNREGSGIITAITLNLHTTLETASGKVTVSRNVKLLPEDVLDLLRRQAA